MPLVYHFIYMEKSWYLIIEGTTHGPYTPEELLREPAFTPDTLVWRDGMEGWLPARDVPELKELFKDHADFNPLPEEDPSEASPSTEGDVLLAVKKEPPFFLIWLIIAALIFIYLAIQFFMNA